MRSGPIAAAVTCAALAGCGGSGSTPTTAPRATSVPSADVQTLLTYAGGHAATADRRAAPIVFGYVNQSRRAPMFDPEATAAVALVNRQMGGIDGHPIRLRRCPSVATAEAARRCGELLAADPAVRIVLEFDLAAGIAAFHAAVDAQRLPIAGAVPVGLADVLDRRAFYSSGGTFATAPAYVKYAIDHLHADDVALVNIPDDANSTATARLLKQTFENAGLTVEQSSFSVGRSAIAGPLATSGAPRPDAIVAVVQTARQCEGLARALKALDTDGTPVIAPYSCVDAALKTSLGDYPKWTYASSFASPLAPAGDPATAAAVAASDAFRKLLPAAAADDPNAVLGLQTVLAGARLVNDGGGASATRASITAAGRRFAGPFLLGPPRVSFGSIPSLPAVPGLGVRFSTYDGDSKWSDPTGGAWVVGDLGR